MLMIQNLLFDLKARQRNLDDVVHRIKACLLEVREWMDAKYLKLNNENTEVVLFGSRHQLSKVYT